MPRSGRSIDSGRQGGSSNGHMSSLPTRFHGGTFGYGATHSSDPFFPDRRESITSDSLGSFQTRSSPNFSSPELEGTIHSACEEIHDTYEIYFRDEEEKKPGFWLKCCRCSPKLLAALVLLTVIVVAVVVPVVGTSGKNTMQAENNLLSGNNQGDQGSGDDSQARRRDFVQNEIEHLMPLLRQDELLMMKAKRK